MTLEQQGEREKDNSVQILFLFGDRIKITRELVGARVP